MNWFKEKSLNNNNIISSVFSLKSKIKKFAYMSKGHSVDFNDTMDSDGYNCKVQLTESKNKIVLTAVFMNNVHSFPLYSETWKYGKEETRRALKTYNRCINIIEDLKAEYEDDEIPGPTLQGMARESLRYLDIDRKNEAPSRSLEAAKYLDGVSDWRSSLYGNRLPGQYQHPSAAPIVNITNTGSGSININTDKK